MSSDPSPSLLPLFDRLEQGDPDAINDILAHCQERFLRLTHQMLRGYPGVRRQEDTHAIYQMVAIRLFRSLRRRKFNSPKHFLCRASIQIQRTLTDLARRKQREYEAANHDPTGDSTNSPEKLLMWGEFHAAVAKLPEDERQLFDVLFYQGLSQPEASRVLDVPLSTLKQRWLDARANLMLGFRNQPPV